MGTDAWALIVAILALVVAGYGIHRQNTYAAREDQRREGEIAGRPSHVVATVGHWDPIEKNVSPKIGDGEISPIKYHQWTPAGAPVYWGGLAVVLHNVGERPVDVNHIDVVLRSDAAGRESVMTSQSVASTGPSLPATLAHNSATYLVGFDELQTLTRTLLPADGEVRYGFRVRFSDQSEIVTPLARLVFLPPTADDRPGEIG
ncbi:hypothetical protein [Klenkia terrae]|jgi:hypothetical protein|uniref:DUF4352 domain-containing protein n=1 Tax=Klenkia terrae TaxID=1052259 RepID=A0ABU8EAF4_9ACTN|nr:hypothetical protein [Klenkia terrae]SSC25768.1 Hypothetical protein KLENKIAIHU_4393 [Klenkia terrae]